MPSWEELSKPGTRERAEPSAESNRFDELCAAVFQLGNGQQLLLALRARYIERRLPPGASEEMLREAEAERRFIFDLERARDRGLDVMAKAKPKPA